MSYVERGEKREIRRRRRQCLERQAWNVNKCGLIDKSATKGNFRPFVLQLQEHLSPIFINLGLLLQKSLKLISVLMYLYQLYLWTGYPNKRSLLCFRDFFLMSPIEREVCKIWIQGQKGVLHLVSADMIYSNDWLRKFRWSFRNHSW